jgi:ribonuclease-3
VRKETCADVAREIDLGAVLRLGKSEMATGGRRKQALLGDAMEAVIAAVYLDGGFEAGARDDPAALGHARDGGGRRCARCQDRAAGMGAGAWSRPAGLCRDRPHRTGPCAGFHVEARLDTGETARAEGRVKRQAEQAAARDLLDGWGLARGFAACGGDPPLQSQSLGRCPTRNDAPSVFFER